jgi:hypothetical protein
MGNLAAANVHEPRPMRAKLSHRSSVRELRRPDAEQTSLESKMRVYLAAHAGKQHQRQFGWKISACSSS